MRPRACIVAVLAVLAIVVGAGFVTDVPASADTSGSCSDEDCAIISPVLGGFYFCQTGNCEIPLGDVLEKDVYAWAQNLQIDGTLDGDLVAWFQNGTIDGAVTQDVNVFSQALTITGEVGDDVRFAGNNINILGTVRGNVMAGASFVRVGEGAVIEGDLLVGAGTVTIDGDVKGGVRMATGHLTMNGTIEGDAYIATDGGITMGDDASIGGDLHYEGPAEIQFRHGAVRGAITFKASDRDFDQDIESAIGEFKTMFGIVAHIYLFLAALIAGSVIFAFTKDHANRTAEILRTKPLKSLGIGFIAAICVPIICGIMVLLLLPIPLSFVVFSVYLVALYIAKFYVAAWLGKLILRNRPADASPIPPMLLGLTILYLLTWIPILGFLITLVVVFFGLGALLQRKETRLNGAFEPAPAPEPPGLPERLPPGPQG
jgi:cytoskeletal protein CcmA (bactofilin family)